MLLKWKSPSSLTLRHFSTNSSETFRIDVNMDFANTSCARFLIYCKPPKKLSSKSKKNGFVWILRSQFFWGLKLRPHMGGIVWCAWTKNHSLNVMICPGLPFQLLARNRFFQSDRPELPLNGTCPN